MDPAHLSDKLVDALTTVVPRGFTVAEEDGMVMISGAGYRAAADVAEVIDQAGDVMKRAEAAAMEALTTVQDYVAETSGAPWPGEGTQMPLARCRVTENEIEMWFQDDSGRRVLEVPTVNW